MPCCCVLLLMWCAPNPGPVDFIKPRSYSTYCTIDLSYKIVREPYTTTTTPTNPTNTTIQHNTTQHNTTQYHYYYHIRITARSLPSPPPPPPPPPLLSSTPSLHRQSLNHRHRHRHRPTTEQHHRLTVRTHLISSPPTIPALEIMPLSKLV